MEEIQVDPEYWQNTVKDPAQNYKLLWQSVLARAVRDWKELNNSYDIIMHRELFRFIFFKSDMLTAETICNDYLDDEYLLKRVRLAAIRAGQKQNSRLLTLDLACIDSRVCPSCKKKRLFYDRWGYLESHIEKYKNNHKRKTAEYINHCFSCYAAAWQNNKIRWQYGTRRKMIMLEMEQSKITLKLENIKEMQKQY